MKQANLHSKSTFVKLLFCAILTIFLASSTRSFAQTLSYGLPTLKSATQAYQDLNLEYGTVLTAAKQQGPNSTLWPTVKVYQRVLDALLNRSDPNMSTYDVVLSSMDMQEYSHLVVKNGNHLDMDATIKALLATQEYQSLIRIIKN
ncbi:MAG: hypothetical protein IPN15_18680 [Saprospiraceae bacterium]|nr:hypothetical protein [Candidatus Vicinibacter affinis]